MAEDQRVEFAFLPWLTLPEPVAVSNVRFVPVSLHDPMPEFVDPWGNLVRELLATFKTFAGRERPGWVVVELDGKLVWDTKDSAAPDHREHIWSACEILAIACIDRNEPFQLHGQRVHSGLFRPRYQEIGHGRGIIRHGQRSKFGSLGHLELFDTPQREPLNCTALPVGAYDGVNSDLISALQPLLAPESSMADGDLQVKRALHLYLLGYSEEPTRTQEDDLAQIIGAMDALLHKGRDSKEKLAATLCSLLDFSVTSDPLSQTRRYAKLETSSVPAGGGGGRDPGKHILWNWFVDAYEYRSKYRHKGQRSPGNPLWTVREHDQFATLLFPLLLKYFLSKDGRFTLKPEDLARRDAIPVLLGKGDFDAKDGTQESRWDREFSISLIPRL
jgi:hypothetical protein